MKKPWLHFLKNVIWSAPWQTVGWTCSECVKVRSSQHTLYPPCYQWPQKGTHPYGMVTTLIRSVMYSSPSSCLNLCSTICYLVLTSLLGWSFPMVIQLYSEMLAGSGWLLGNLTVSSWWRRRRWLKSHSDVGKAGYPNGLSLATYGMFIGSIYCSIKV